MCDMYGTGFADYRKVMQQAAPLFIEADSGLERQARMSDISLTGVKINTREPKSYLVHPNGVVARADLLEENISRSGLGISAEAALDLAGATRGRNGDYRVISDDGLVYAVRINGSIRLGTSDYGVLTSIKYHGKAH